MDYKLSEIAEYVNGELLGDPEYRVFSLGALDQAQADQLSFLSNPKYVSMLALSEAGAVLIRDRQDASKVRNAILVRNPYLAFAEVSELFKPVLKGWPDLVHPSAVIHENAEIAEDVEIGPNVTVMANASIAAGSRIDSGCVIGENVILGTNCQLAANVTLYQGVQAGHRCIFHSGAVIGADGFGFAPSEKGWTKIHQLGRVVLGDDVEVGANTTIDRGAIENTVIGNGVKIDNLVQIAHNVVIGDNSAIAGCVGIAGSAKIGKACTIAGGAGVAGHLTIVDNVHVTAMSLVTRSIKESGSYSSGTALDSTSNWRKSAARLRRIENMASQISKLEKQVNKLLTEG